MAVAAYLNSMKEQTDILVSGGGVAGLVAAIAFGNAGFDVICVDPTPPVTERDAEGSDLRTTAFLQPARDFLDLIGLWSSFDSYATPLTTMRIVDASSDDQITRDFVSSDISDRPFGWNLPNWLLRREMLAHLGRLPNVQFRAGVATTSVFTRQSEARVKLSDGTTVLARLVIAADGRGSPMREAAGIDVKTTRFGQKALSFAVTHDVPHDTVSTEVHRSGGPFTLVPLPDHDGKPCSAVVWMEDGAEVTRLLALDPKEFEAEATDRSAHVAGQLRLATRRTAWPIISQIADRMSAERIALIAETAHVVPPIGAQGLNMSLGDIKALLSLAQVKPDTLGDAEMLDAYHRKRMSPTKLRVSGITWLNRASQADQPMAQAARAMGLRALHGSGTVRKSLMKLGLGASG